MVRMQDVRHHIEKDLSTIGISSELDNLTDDTLGFKILQGNKKTHLRLYRQRHKPLEVVLEADYTQYKLKKAVFDRANKSQQQGRGGFFRYYMYFIIFGFVASILLYFFTALRELYVDNTPGWTTIQRTLPIITIVVIIIFWVLYIGPKLRRIKNTKVREFERDLIDQVKNSLIDLNQQIHGSDKMKCWSCFKEISSMAKTCDFCSANQN
jgi:hypothetical protein